LGSIINATMADRIGPDYAPKRSFGEKVRRLGKAFTTKYGFYHELHSIADSEQSGTCRDI
jgi:hypothetical protein